MRTLTHPADALLARHNPIVPLVSAAPAPLDDRARADLARILAADPAVDASGADQAHSARTPTRRVAVLSAAAVLAAAAVAFAGVSVFGSHAAYAATPKPLNYQPVHASVDPAALLARIAARSAALPDTTGHGRYAHVTTRSWSLFTRVDGKQITSAVVPERREQWIAADGSGRVVVTANLPGGRHVHRDHTATTGELGLMWPMHSLSANEAVLARQLQAGHPVDNGPAERFAAIRDAYLETPIRPAVRAAILRYLAATPTLSVTGQVTDRVGRTGIGFSIDSAYSGLPTRYTFIIDRDTGRLLDSQTLLTTSAGNLNVQVPCVIGYTVFLGSRYTNSTR